MNNLSYYIENIQKWVFIIAMIPLSFKYLKYFINKNNSHEIKEFQQFKYFVYATIIYFIVSAFQLNREQDLKSSVYRSISNDPISLNNIVQEFNESHSFSEILKVLNKLEEENKIKLEKDIACKTGKLEGNMRNFHITIISKR